MHVFQPYPIDLLELNPFTKIGDEWLTITAGNNEKANTMTASWGGLGVLWNKNVAFIFVRDSRYTKEFLDNELYFSCTFFEHTYHSALKYLGAVSGRDEPKIDNARLHLNYSESAPFIDEGNFVVILKKLATTRLTPDNFFDSKIDAQFYKDKNYHTMYIGEVIKVLAR